MRWSSLVEMTGDDNSASDTDSIMIRMYREYMSSESPPPPPPPNLAEMGIKTLSYPGGIYIYIYTSYIYFQKTPSTFELTPGGSFFAKKNTPAPEHRKIGSFSSGKCQLFAVVVL